MHGLVALMEIQSSRLRARAGPEGEPIPLLEQDRGRWDRLLIRRGFAALLRAERLGGPPGPYVVQAAIAACHAQAAAAADTDWPRIAALYQTLAMIAPSPVAELNRAVAVGMAYGPARGLELADRLAAGPELRRYHLLPSVRGDLLAKLGRARGGPGRVRAGRRAHPERSGAHRAAAPRGRMRPRRPAMITRTGTGVCLHRERHDRGAARRAAADAGQHGGAARR